ncbi:MAG TPA: VTT domain-containing protein [Paracoccaceae bacterium]|nr:VTT domain-containing protein [Paracoccaceae bacterium]
MGDRAGRIKAGRWLLLAALLAGAAAAFWLAGDRLNYAALQENHRELEAWRDRNTGLAIALFVAVYVGAVAFSVPGAVWLTLIGGFLFGIIGGAALAVVSATIGATLIFLAARTVLAEPLRRRAGGWIGRLERGFRQGEASFLLIMRLVPAVPFWIANLAPAFLGARPRTFVWTTFVGIVPGTLVTVSIGAGLGEQLDRGERPDLGVVFEPHILGPLLGLAALAALPLVLRWLGVIWPVTGAAE